MKSWKVLLGIGGACVACCAFPVAATVTAIFAGAGGGLALYSGSVFPVAGAATAIGLAVAAVWWRRRATRKEAACSLAAPVAACGCPPGQCG
jgi:predicted secreted Zn-dependent protease